MDPVWFLCPEATFSFDKVFCEAGNYMEMHDQMYVHSRSWLYADKNHSIPAAYWLEMALWLLWSVLWFSNLTCMHARTSLFSEYTVDWLVLLNTSWTTGRRSGVFRGQLVAYRVHVHASERWKTRMVQLELHSAQLRRAGARELLPPIIHRLLPRKRQNSRCAQRHCAVSAGIEFVLESSTSVNCQFAPVCTLTGRHGCGFSFAVVRGRVRKLTVALRGRKY